MIEGNFELFVLFLLVVSFLWGSKPVTFVDEFDQFLKDIVEVDVEQE